MKPPAQPRPSRADIWICLGLLVAVFAVYAQVRGFEFINYDDPDYVTANSHVRSGLNAQSVAWAFTSTDDANWFPLTRLSHLIDVQLFGLDSGAQHATNVLIHAASVLLLFVLMKRITRAAWPSAFVAFVFAVHPLHVESVAWISERKDVLSGLFWMLTLLAYVRYTNRPNAARYTLMLVLFCCGLMSKPMIVTLPFVMLLIDYWRGRTPWKRAVIEKLPLFALAIAASAITYVVQQRGGSVSTFAQVPLGFRIGNAAVSYFIYLFQFVWPAKLAVFYPYAPARPAWMEISAGIALIVITAAVLFISVSRRAPRYVAVGWLWYVGTLVPVIGLIQVGAQSRADRYTYIPLIGISIIIAFGAAEMIARRPSWKPAMAVCAAVVCAAWAAAAWTYTGAWQTTVRLFEHALQSTQVNYLAEENLGGALLSQGRLDEAVPHILEAVRLDPKSAESRVNLGTALLQRRMLDEAEVQYRAAIALQPESAAARRGLGNVLAQKGRLEEALAQFKEALRMQPDDPDTHYNLGLLAAQMGNQEEAIARFTETVRLQPSSVDARFNLGTALAQAHRFEEAAAAFQEAVKLKPDYVRAYFNLGSSLATIQRYDEAARAFEQALQLQPDFVEAQKNLELCRELAGHAK